MTKSFPFYSAFLTQSGLMLRFFRATSVFVVGVIALALAYNKAGWLAIGIASFFELLVLEWALRWRSELWCEIRFNDIGDVVLVDQTSSYLGELSDYSLVCDWWCFLRISHPGTSKPDTLLTIWRDMVDERSYRRLSRMVRIKRRLI
jgi:hypothetical protein